jgi:dihydrodipicolinate synthase/N-acetylneuraminate lyase
MASAFPDVVRTGLDAADEDASRRLRSLRDAMEASGQFIAAAKHVLGARGVPVGPGMRAPLRRLTADEATALDAAVADFLPAGTRS